jgi:hypothetical protein
MPSPDQNPFRRYILPVALGIGALVGGKSPEKPEIPPQHETESKEPFHFELGPLAQQFELQEQVIGRHTILFFTQMHPGFSMENDKETGAQPFIIQSQKEIEQLVLYAKGKYGCTTIFVEGYDEGDGSAVPSIFSQLDAWDRDFDRAVAGRDIRGAEKLLTDLLQHYNSILAKQPEKVNVHSLLAYFLKKRAAKLEPLTGDTSLTDTLINLKFGDLETVYGALGAPGKLFVDGFKIRSADNFAARMSSLEMHKHAPGQEAPAEVKEKFHKDLYALNKIREDAVVRTMNDWMTANNEIKAIYVGGRSHDLRSNVKDENLLHPSAHPGTPQEIGLIRLQWKGAQEFREKYAEQFQLTDLTDPEEK